LEHTASDSAEKGLVYGMCRFLRQKGRKKARVHASPTAFPRLAVERRVAWKLPLSLPCPDAERRSRHQSRHLPRRSLSSAPSSQPCAFPSRRKTGEGKRVPRAGGWQERLNALIFYAGGPRSLAALVLEKLGIKFSLKTSSTVRLYRIVVSVYLRVSQRAPGGNIRLESGASYPRRGWKRLGSCDPVLGW
jgi:hypothetical protein